MTSPANQTDLSDRSLRTLSSEEATVGVVLLADSWGILTARVAGLSARNSATPADTGLRSLIVQVQCAMVLRVLNNPNGKLQESQDDYSYRLDAAVSTGALYVSDAEIALLGANNSLSGGGFTIKPFAVAPTQPDTWVSVGGASI
jgi:hypothetical protein